MSGDWENPNVTLDSFVISQTPYTEVQWWGEPKDALEARHIVFSSAGNQHAVGRLFELMGLPAAG